MKSKIQEYILAHTQKEEPLLEKLSRETYQKMLNPRMLSGHYLGVFLTFIVRMLKPKRVLEIGTFTGYSAICMAKGMESKAVLHTIDKNEELQRFTDDYFEKSRQKSKIVSHVGDALKIIPKINETFDLVFIDAKKSEYMAYYRLIFPKLRIGGFIIADNALWDGKVVKRKFKKDTETAAIVEFNAYIQHDERVENILLPIRDGLMLIWKK